MLGVQAPGRVHPRHTVGPRVGFAPGADCQVAVLHGDVVRKSSGVVLQFLVAPAVATHSKCPLLRIWRSVTIEFIGPYQGPVR